MLHKSTGKVIEGKWKNNRYKVIKLLGEGGIAKVYKVMDLTTDKVYALKLSDDLISITKEYDMLKKYDKLKLFPRIKEIDDVLGKKEYFLVMEYISGKNLKEYLHRTKITVEDILGLAIIIGNTFTVLHKNNHIFGDLKLENLMIDKKKNLLRIIDFGGVTPIGNGIQEYTSLYDRATWNKGLRKADKEYDLFSLNIFISNLLLNNTLSKMERSVDKLVKELQTVDISSQLLNLIHKGLNQSRSFEAYMQELREIYHKRTFNVKYHQRKRLDKIINCILISSILLFAAMITILMGKT